MPVKLNRHVNLLVMLMTLTAAGCSQNAKDALSVNELLPNQDNAYVDHYYQNYQPITQDDHEYNLSTVFTAFHYPDGCMYGVTFVVDVSAGFGTDRGRQ